MLLRPSLYVIQTQWHQGNVAHRDEASISYCYMLGKSGTP